MANPAVSSILPFCRKRYSLTRECTEKAMTIGRELEQDRDIIAREGPCGVPGAVYYFKSGLLFNTVELSLNCLVKGCERDYLY